jgi:hypothetical protein
MRPWFFAVVSMLLSNDRTVPDEHFQYRRIAARALSRGAQAREYLIVGMNDYNFRLPQRYIVNGK